MIKQLFALITDHRLLITILVFASVLRFYALNVNPPHLTNDEAALGYNAYSILKTAKDEHGAFLPITFESFGDWKPGLYIYLTVPFVYLFGLNEFSVRFVSALSGVIAVLLLYFIVYTLSKNKKLALFSAFFLSISPWHLQFSRGAWEANLGLTLTLMGIYFFVQAINEASTGLRLRYLLPSLRREQNPSEAKKSSHSSVGLHPRFSAKGDKNAKYLIVSGVCFAFTLLAYQGAKLSTLIAVCILVVTFWGKINKLSKKVILISFLTACIVCLPIVFSLLQGKAGRLEIYSIFSYTRPEQAVQEILHQGKEEKTSLSVVLYHSENLNHLRSILGRWFNHYSGRFLFFEGDWGPARHRVPNNGVLLLGDIILLFFGVRAIIKSNNFTLKKFVLLFLILSPLPAALSKDVIHSIRSYSLVIPLCIMLAFGAIHITSLKKTKIYKLLFSAFLIIYFAGFVYYLDQYWVHAPVKYSADWHYGHKQLVEKITPIQGNYPEIIIEQSYTQPYIFFLFYQKYDPAKYQQEAIKNFEPSKFGDVGLVTKLDNITFRATNWSADRGMSGKLFVSDPVKVPVVDSTNPQEFNILDDIEYLNGETALRLIEIK